ncbi:hypothetical protein ACIQ6K_39670 [Streptomyces sp. NPDC096354]|uniref:hypothetical protein n=1 Tax=Streptomyces sp. NPDC096354 TaxID=3366088 RepID=UPI0037F5EE2E
MLIVDRELGIVPASAGRAGSPAGSVLVHPSTLLDGLIELFEMIWTHALPIPPGAGAADGTAADADEADRRLLTLLLSGLTDSVIAR